MPVSPIEISIYGEDVVLGPGFGLLLEDENQTTFFLLLEQTTSDDALLLEG